MADWYQRPVLGVGDVERAVDFYVQQLGFARAWSHEEAGQILVAEVRRQGCELILSSQWPERVGKGLVFLSLDLALLQAFRAEIESRAVSVRDDHWGYRTMVVSDPDGNELYFPYPSDAEAR